MEDRLGELLQFGQGNPFLNEPAAEEQEPFLDEFFAKVEQIRSQIKTMRGGVIELKQDYAAALDQARHLCLPSSPFSFPHLSLSPPRLSFLLNSL